MEYLICDFIGWFLYKIGVPANHSSGIHGGPTAGYGKLDHNGYFRFPVYNKREL